MPARLSAALARVRGAGWSIAQCSLAASLAWAAAEALLGHERPFFATVAAVVCLGVRVGQRLRRVGELAVGVTVGVAVGDLLAERLGTGAWQVGVVVGIALLLAVALDGGPLLVAQSGLQAVFVIALPRTPGSDLARWEDALVGGAVALAVAALLPADPWRPSRRAAARALGDLAEIARCTAQAVRHGDAGEAADALAAARRTQAGLDAWAEALVAGRETTRLSPLRRDRVGTHAALARLHAGTDRATRNARVLVRRVVFALETGEPLPGGLADVLDGLAAAAEAVPVDAAEPPPELLALAAALDPASLVPVAPGPGALSASVVVAQLRSAVVDLLVATGLPPEQARSALPPYG